MGISYTAEHRDLSLDIKCAVGKYHYVGVTKENESPIYRIDNKKQKPGCKTCPIDRCRHYLFKDWSEDKFWKVVVIYSS